MTLQEGGYDLFFCGVDGKVEDKLCSEPKKLVGFGFNMPFVAWNVWNSDWLGI